MLASAYQALHCNISNQLARELCQIRWKRSAHKERSIDLKAELLWASALLNNFTHYLLQQDLLFSSISKCCSSDSQGSWSNIRVFQLQYNIYLIHCCSCSAKPALQLSHSLLWKIFYQPMNSLDLLRNIKMLRQPFKEKCYWLSSATEKFLRIYSVFVVQCGGMHCLASSATRCYFTDHHWSDAFGCSVCKPQTARSHTHLIFSLG